MGTITRRRLAWMLGALAAVGIAVASAVILADRRSETALDVPEGGLRAPERDDLPPLDLVVDEPGGGEAEGLVWTLCCGAWRPPGAFGVDLDSVEDRRRLGSLDWTRRGYLAAVSAAHGGPTSVDQAVAAYDRLRADHPDLPICAVGGSAAGHMALMVAVRRPGLRCVVAHSAPTALADLPDEPLPGVLPIAPIDLARRAFGPQPLEELSPLAHAGDIVAHVRLTACSADGIVPPSQSRRLARALRRGRAAEVELAVVPGVAVPRGERAPRGTEHLVHECFIRRTRLRRWRTDTVAFVERTLASLRSR